MLKWILLFMAFNASATILLEEDTAINLSFNNTFLEIGSEKLGADSIDYEPFRSKKLKVKFVIKTIDGLEKTIPLKFNIFNNNGKKIWSSKNENDLYNECVEDQNYLVRAKLENNFVRIKTRSRKTYFLEEKIKCSKSNVFTFRENSLSGGALSIWEISQIITMKLQKSNIINFWKKKLKITYPGKGDYYNIFGVNLTVGHHWDVVGHEIGHAVYAMAKIGVSGTGQHKIDECYSNELALSEGWASFFSAWVSIKLNDENAQFEYMVSRRAPLGVEHIPSDVCHGENNEWRVFGFLWDLIDKNNDNIHFNLSFKKLWKLMKLKKLTKISDVKNRILDNGYDPILINILWDHNIFDDIDL